jgi:hypothetical protein
MGRGCVTRRNLHRDAKFLNSPSEDALLFVRLEVLYSLDNRTHGFEIVQFGRAHIKGGVLIFYRNWLRICEQQLEQHSHYSRQFF